MTKDQFNTDYYRAFAVKSKTTTLFDLENYKGKTTLCNLHCVRGATVGNIKQLIVGIALEQEALTRVAESTGRSIGFIHGTVVAAAHGRFRFHNNRMAHDLDVVEVVSSERARLVEMDASLQQALLSKGSELRTTIHFCKPAAIFHAAFTLDELWLTFRTCRGSYIGELYAVDDQSLKDLLNGIIRYARQDLPKPAYLIRLVKLVYHNKSFQVTQSTYDAFYADKDFQPVLKVLQRSRPSHKRNIILGLVDLLGNEKSVRTRGVAYETLSLIFSENVKIELEDITPTDELHATYLQRLRSLRS